MIASNAPALRTLATGDFDRDGDTDFTLGTGNDVALPATHQNALLLMRNNGLGVMRSPRCRRARRY